MKVLRNRLKIEWIELNVCVCIWECGVSPLDLGPQPRQSSRHLEFEFSVIDILDGSLCDYTRLSRDLFVYCLNRVPINIQLNDPLQCDYVVLLFSLNVIIIIILFCSSVLKFVCCQIHFLTFKNHMSHS